jgi:hypothetical protein
MMRVYTLSGYDWRRAAQAAGGVAPVTSPPAEAETLDLAAATKANIFYLNLHGFIGQSFYYGQRYNEIGPTALTLELVSRYRWDGVVIFAEVCFSAAGGGGPIARRFLENGAKAFIGSVSEAYGRIRATGLREILRGQGLDGEADRLMALFRLAYGHSRCGDPGRALELAKRWLSFVSFPHSAADKATLESFICLRSK